MFIFIHFSTWANHKEKFIYSSGPRSRACIWWWLSCWQYPQAVQYMTRESNHMRDLPKLAVIAKPL